MVWIGRISLPSGLRQAQPDDTQYGDPKCEADAMAMKMEQVLRQAVSLAQSPPVADGDQAPEHDASRADRQVLGGSKENPLLEDVGDAEPCATMPHITSRRVMGPRAPSTAWHQRTNGRWKRSYSRCSAADDFDRLGDISRRLDVCCTDVGDTSWFCSRWPTTGLQARCLCPESGRQVLRHQMTTVCQSFASADPIWMR